MIELTAASRSWQPLDRTGLRLPVWAACSAPAPLIGLALPEPDFPFQVLATQFNVEVMISLDAHGTALDCAPLRQQHFHLEDLYRKSAPTDAAAERQIVHAAAETVHGLLDAGTGTAVHCLGGIGRTGTVIGLTAVRFGAEPASVAAWLNEIHANSGGWPECPWQGEMLSDLQ
ncbi:MAG: hypothetical protein ACRBK7_22040 [Acidimicrobiales bacterium]